MQKYARTIEELALHRERNGGGKEWLREFMDNLETIASNVYKYVRAVENSFLWENCRSTLCEDKRSFGAFQRDIITFITDASDVATLLVRKQEKALRKPLEITKLDILSWQVKK